MLSGAMRLFPAKALVLSLLLLSSAGHALVADARADVGREIITTRHTITVQGTRLSYTARAGFIPLIDKATGEARAKIFFVSYTVERQRGSAERPLTFYTSGGPAEPGTLAELGPRVLKGATTQEHLPPPPYQMVDNQNTWLTFTDLVLIDPVGTGYSRATRPEYAARYYNPQGDAESIAKFIQLYLRRYEPLMRQPIFVAGWSYGALRSARIADFANRRGIPLRGLILASSPLENRPLHAVRPLVRGQLPFEYSDLTYVQLLPTFTATAFFHRKLPPKLQGNFDEALRQSESWATNEYPKILARPDHFSRDKLQVAAAQMARLIGLSPKVVLIHRFRLMPGPFLREPLGKVIDFHDSRRITAEYSDAYDKNWGAVLSSLYLGGELHFRSRIRYAASWDVLTDGVAGAWQCLDLFHDCFGEPQARASLQRAMRGNPSLRVMITNGYYDLVCPYFGTKMAIGQLQPNLRARVSATYFQAGHSPPPEFRAAVGKFMQSTLARTPVYPKAVVRATAPLHSNGQ